MVVYDQYFLINLNEPGHLNNLGSHCTVDQATFEKMDGC